MRWESITSTTTANLLQHLGVQRMQMSGWKEWRKLMHVANVEAGQSGARNVVVDRWLSLVASRQAILHQIVTVNWAGICMQSLHYIIYAMLQSGWPNGPPSLQPQAYFHFVSVCIAAGVLVTCCLIHVIVTITNVILCSKCHNWAAIFKLIKSEKFNV